MGALLDEVGGTLDLAALVPFARWLPAHVHHTVFDTRFYLARGAARRRAGGRRQRECPRLLGHGARGARRGRSRRGARSSSRRAAISNGSHCSPASPTRPPMPARIRCARSRPGSRSATAASISAFPTISAIRSPRSRWRERCARMRTIRQAIAARVIAFARAARHLLHDLCAGAEPAAGPALDAARSRPADRRCSPGASLPA